MSKRTRFNLSFGLIGFVVVGGGILTSEAQNSGSGVAPGLPAATPSALGSPAAPALLSAPTGASLSGAAAPTAAGGALGSGIVASPQYVLRQGDVVQVRVYQEEDLTTVSRIGREGTITMPLLGSVTVVSNSLEAATLMIRDLLAKDYLVNPQVTLNITEFAKRRFTVMGQVQHPGTFEMPGDDSVSLLQAIATAGGYTRIGNARKIIVARTVGKQKKVMELDAEALAGDKTQKPFEVLPDDVIVVREKWL